MPRIYTSIPAIDRFTSKVEIDWDTGCWFWIAYRARNGYGKFQVSLKHGTKVELAHRFSYLKYRGEIPNGLQLDHLCRVRHCVNPWHLEAVTKAENMRRGVWQPILNLKKTHCPQGHPYEGENLHITPRGTRDCRACKRVTDAEYRDRIRKGLTLNEYRLLYGIKSEKT